MSKFLKFFVDIHSKAYFTYTAKVFSDSIIQYIINISI